MIIDTHAHYDDDAFREDMDELLSSFPNRSIELVVNASASMEECKATIELMEKYPFVYGMLGVHPDEVYELNETAIPYLEKKCNELKIANGGKIVAVGEIGLDYSREEADREKQKYWFMEQLRLAKRVKLPVNIHSRDAANDTLDILKKEHAEDIGGIIHCYSYSVEMAREFLKLGFGFGIGGVVTFKNARKLVEAVTEIPMENIVLETDAPYLAPTPHRGERNDSSNLSLVAAKIAELKGLTPAEVINITNKNAKRIYGIDGYTG